MRILFSHPTGNANVRAATKGLNKAGLLTQFRTSIALFEGSIFDNCAIGPLSEFRRRRFDIGLKTITYQSPLFELVRILSQKFGINVLTKNETGIFSIDKVYQRLDISISKKLMHAKKKGIDSIYAYEDGAFFSFSVAKKLNLVCFYDLPIGYWRASRRLMAEEISHFPEWEPTLLGFQDSDLKLARKDKELMMADRIFVASQFTANTLKDFPGKLAPIEVIPYGFPPVRNIKSYNYNKNRPLKLLFVGGLSQRKGLAQLFEAVQNIGDKVELTIIGKKTGAHCIALDKALLKHKWIPSIPHHEILNQMHFHDVLVFPSLFEGFGLVITEAMSQGTPVITTERTAGPEFIKHGYNGWIVQAGSTNALQSAIENLIENPSLVEKAGKLALETARSRPWEVYGNELAKALLKSLSLK